MALAWDSTVKSLLHIIEFRPGRLLRPASVEARLARMLAWPTLRGRHSTQESLPGQPGSTLTVAPPHRQARCCAKKTAIKEKTNADKEMNKYAIPSIGQSLRIDRVAKSPVRT
jgi:hypothetical protein